MLDFKDAIEGESIVRVHDGMPGEIIEIGDRRPVRVRVMWQDGSQQWMHPEQICKPSALPPQPSIALSGFGRTTPPYLISLRKTIRDARGSHWKKKPSKAELKHDADRILSTKGRKRKGVIKALKKIYD